MLLMYTYNIYINIHYIYIGIILDNVAAMEHLALESCISKEITLDCIYQGTFIVVVVSNPNTDKLPIIYTI